MKETPLILNETSCGPAAAVLIVTSGDYFCRRLHLFACRNRAAAANDMSPRSDTTRLTRQLSVTHTMLLVVLIA